MKYYLFLFLLISANPIKASNYYFSAVLGEDGRTPLQARSPATPWKTLDKLNSFFSDLKPGDSVLLKRGETFYGSITVNRSGTSSAPIVIGAYGAGNKPVITGFVSLTLASSGNNIYESQALTAAAVNVLTLNGAMQAMGRFPNSGYLSFESHAGTTSITDNDLAPTPNWTGAELVLRSRRWVIDRDIITSHSGNTISYTAASRYEPKDKYGYFIQNSPLTLDSQGEWYYNPSTKKILLYSTSTPKNANVAVIDNLVTSSANSHVTISNIMLEGANKNAININSGSDIRVINCTILSSGEDGVKVNSHRGFKLENSTVANSLNNGIELGPNAPYAVVTNNTVQNTSLLPGMGLSADKRGIGIYTTSSNNLIAYNKVTNSGYIGIYFGGDSTTIQNNFVDSFCSVKDDGGGIYTYIGAGGRRVGRKIIGNIVINGFGAPAGTDNQKQMEATGIYLDDNTSDVEIRDNTIANCNNQGIFIQNTRSVIVVNNTFFDNHVQLGMAQRPNKLTRDNTITQNIFFSKLPTQMVSSFQSAADDVDQFGKFDSNYYVKPVNNSLFVYNTRVNKGAGNDNSTSEIQGWRTKYGKDETPKAMAAAAAIPFNPNYSVRFEYNPTKTNKTVTLDGAYTDLKNNKFNNSIVLPPYSSAVLIKQK